MIFESNILLVLYCVALLLLIFFIKPILQKIKKQRIRACNCTSYLSIKGQISLDRTRRLSVVTYGTTEVLILTGGTQDLILESGNKPGFASLVEQKS
ncbi:hypothetical protein [Swingsia samuiensis]|uniref:Uncharacterized protein n=1 Tax=Swingsia samuiensis TaxID=1293412 RepID=A0A4Y6UG86_9PROT|nr:hypothetical protein [Swingsia samuiensis]QDH16569.1 hypothetical protein E3D00_02515 [Swingsia samuiensis]